VAHDTQSAEYKQVTVLFADVVHSMEIAAAVGAERLREIMADLVDRAVMVVQRYGGTVDKFTGDASWPCSVHRLRWRTTPFVPAWRPWGFRKRHSGLPSTSETLTAWTSGCG
jgi:class 3 adenylate cyclase